MKLPEVCIGPEQVKIDSLDTGLALSQNMSMQVCTGPLVHIKSANQEHNEVFAFQV
jgi:hypothetical protein